MKNIFITVVLTAASLFIGCEREKIINPEEIHIENLVVQAEINPGKLFPAVRFTKTLPLGVPYNIKQAELKKVTAYIIKNSVQVIPLHYTSDGLYRPRYDFYVNEGETYELIAEDGGKFIYAKTIIPFKPNVSSVNYNNSNYYLEANVSSRLNEVYGALWIIPGNPAVRANDYYSVTEPAEVSSSSSIVRTSSIPENFRGPGYSDNRFIQVYAFDVAFRKYFYSRSSSQQVNDPFIQGSGAVEWNVQGDKVIGMFIGISAGDVIKVN